MKKIISLILLMCMVLSISACGKVEITMQEIYDAVQTEAMLKNHQSVHIKDELDGELINERYLTSDYVFDYVPDAESDWAEFMTDDSCYGYLEGNYVHYLPITPDGVSDGFKDVRAKRYASVLLGEDTLKETIVSTSKKDGNIVVTSTLSAEILESMAEFGVTAGDFEYVLDSKTHEIVSIKGDYTYEGDMSYQMTSKISYDTEVPEMVKTFLGYAEQTENMRNVTVVMNPGTDKEITHSVQVAKGLLVGFRYDEDAENTFEVYTDTACTEAYDAYADTESDLTVYIKWVE